MGFRILRSKLTPPLADDSIERAKLDEWLDRTLLSRLALVHAPAGFGKTTAMLQLLSRMERRGIPTAWLTLDDADNDVGRFLAYLVGALQTVHMGVNQPIDAGSLFGSENVVGDRVLRIRQWMTEDYGGPLALFLDDLEVIQNPEVIQILRRLPTQMLPGQLLVAGTRDIPDLGLARLRVRGLLSEINLDDLRFAWDETDRFLRKARGLDLADVELARLYGCTEGWAAGLQLSALALTGLADRRSVIESFSGSFADIADYLAEDVLARLPQEVREFLLETSILDRLSGPLCDTVTGRSNSYELLSYLERANLFITPLDKERLWYRYHNLFSEFLRGQADRSLAECLPRLHQRAADWLVEQGHSVEAAKHALAAGDLDRAAGLVAQCSMVLVGLGQLRTVADWVDRLPAVTLDRHPELRIALCWALSMRHHHHEAGVVLDQIKNGLDPDAAVDSGVLDQIYSLESVVLSLTDRVEECLHLSEHNLPLIVDHDSFPYGVLCNCLGCRLLEAGRFEEARELLEVAERCHARGGNVFGAMYSACLIGALELLQGGLCRAVERYRAAVTDARRASLIQSQTGAVATVFLAEALYEMNELAEAEQLLAGSRDRFRECVPLDVMLLGYLTLARIHASRGEDAEVDSLLEEALEVGRERETPRAAATVHLERIRLAVQRGDLPRAIGLAREFDDGEVWRTFEGWGMSASDPETAEVSRLRLTIRCGEAAIAIPQLKSELAKAIETRHFRRALKLRILLAEALTVVGDNRAALRLLREAVAIGGREGFVRVFSDEGPPVIGMIAELGDALGPEAAAGDSGIPAGYLDRIMSAASNTGAHPTQPSPAHHDEPCLEPLTTRETEILEMVARGFSNNELAGRLFVSVPTVKFHLRNINTKLRADNRTRAVARARELGLIS